MMSSGSLAAKSSPQYDVSASMLWKAEVAPRILDACSYPGGCSSEEPNYYVAERRMCQARLLGPLGKIHSDGSLN